MFKRLIILLGAVLNFHSLFAQVLPNTFKVKDYVEMLPNDSIKIWYNCVGVISSAKCAEYYRIGKIDSNSIGINGEFKDFDLKGNLIYKAYMLNGMLNGKGTFYYKNGQIKEEGQYLKDSRKGIWKYYNTDGNLIKVLNFREKTPLVVLLVENGNTLINNGNGNYIGEFLPYKGCTPYSISGHIADGKMDGEWKFYNPTFNQLLSTEIFDKGQFIKGNGTTGHNQSYYEYSDGSKIDISGFYANENSNLDENHVGCPGDYVSFLKINSQNINQSFYQNLINKIKRYPVAVKQWVIVAIDFDRKSRIKELNVYSSKDDTVLESFIYKYVRRLDGWQPIRINNQIDPEPLFFTIIIDDRLGDERVLIPAEYVIRHLLSRTSQN